MRPFSSVRPCSTPPTLTAASGNGRPATVTVSVRSAPGSTSPSKANRTSAFTSNVCAESLPSSCWATVGDATLYARSPPTGADASEPLDAVTFTVVSTLTRNCSAYGTVNATVPFASV